MSLGLADGTVRLVEHDVKWHDAFDRIRARLLAVLRGGCIVEHVGSTAVRELPAKPIIDIAVGCPHDEIDPCVQLLLEAGYEYRGLATDGGGHVFVCRDNGLRTHHIHVVPKDSVEWYAYLRFRELLRAEPPAREEYAAAKRSLAERFPNDRKAYSKGKDEIVAALLSQGR